MTLLYLDTSAVVKLLVEEPETSALAESLAQPGRVLLACVLLETELRRFAVRYEISQAEVSAVLDAVSLYEMPRSFFHEAGVLAGPNLRSLDALHLVGALRLGVDAIITYDARMRTAATELGLTTLAPAP